VQKDEREKNKVEEVEVKIFKIPEVIYEDFKDIEIDHRNEELFEFVSYQLVCNFIERICLKIKPIVAEDADKKVEVESDSKPAENVEGKESGD